ncbi:MAG TPA: long-chain fatty acid--CoA ligase [Armatimonadota bacterium]|jgi:hypothetical protein
MDHPLDGRLLRFVLQGEGSFDEIVRQVFAYQYERNVAYQRLCDARGVAPRSLEDWHQIPAVPVRAFKAMDLACEPLEQAEAVFESSGTTLGAHSRSRHFLFGLELYRASVVTHFRPYLIPDRERMVCRVLLPSSAEAPSSSLSRMMEFVLDAFGAEGSRHYVVGGGLLVDELLRDLSGPTEPQMLLGASFSFVHLLDAMASRGMALALPEGSRLMDTGGYKGRSREVPREELLAAYAARLGLDPALCVNEYGMCEMTSQFYEASLRDRLGGRSPSRWLKAPPWVRTQALDPATLRPVEPGEVGLLQHVDLANRGSVMAILTEDLGRVTQEGVQVFGRASTAEAKGCSITVDELLSTGH